MIRRPRIALVAVALLAPLALVPSAASAVDQDLVVSVTSGAPGTRIEVSSASCQAEISVDDEGVAGTYRFLQVRLLSGSPERVLAGFGRSGFDGSGEMGAAVLVVPDWVDADAPAVIEATCIELDLLGEDGIQRETPFDPVPFDVEPGIDPPVQIVSLSRTALRAGQGLTVDVSGCAADGYLGAEVLLSRGAARDGSNLEDAAVFGLTDEDLGSAPAELILNNAGVSIGYSVGGEGPGTVEVEEVPGTIVPGSYTAYALCFDQDGDTSALTALVLEPTNVEVTSTSPTDDVDLVVEPGTRRYEMGGGSCDQDAVRYRVDEESTDERRLDRGDSRAGSRALDLLTPRRPALAKRGAGTPAARSFVDDLLEADASVGADGEWAVGGEAGFDRGFLFALAACGDPFGDGFVYDPQAAVIEVPRVDPPAPPAPPVDPAPTPAPPADAVVGSPRYAG